MACRLQGVCRGSPGSKDTLLLRPFADVGDQIAPMSDSCPSGRYRVRPADQHENTVPNEVLGPLFDHRDEAETYARHLARARQAPVIVEKLAPAGCWLQLAIVG